jgi:hypothetical protein
LWYIPVIPAPGRLQQEELKFEASLGCVARLCLKKGRETSKNSNSELISLDLIGSCECQYQIEITCKIQNMFLVKGL